MRRDFINYSRECHSLAICGSFVSEFSWATVVAAALFGAFIEASDRAVTFATGWQGLAVSALIYTAIAWTAILLFKLIFVAPFQVYQRHRRPENKQKLMEFYVSAGALLNYRLEKDVTAEEFDKYRAMVDFLDK